MFTALKFRLQYGPYLRNEHGIKKFAEMSMGQLIRRATKKSAFYREMNENMLVEKANLRLRREELSERPTLDADGFFSARRSLWANTFMVAAIVVAAIFLNVISAEAFIDEASALSALLRWIAAILMAVVLTGSGTLITERLITTLIPPRAARNEHAQHNRKLSTALWGILLASIELALVGLAEVQGRVLSTGGGSGLLYVGYIVATSMLPLIAGAFYWHSMRFIDRYKTTNLIRQVESRLAQIDSLLRQNEEYESNFYKVKSIEYWDLVNEFKTYKDNVNQNLGIVEPLSGHFAQSYDLFQAEANKRYTQDIRDTTAQSMRKLSLLDGGTSAGSKLGQAARARPTPRPVKHNGSSSSSPEEADEYMSLQPIR